MLRRARGLKLGRETHLSDLTLQLFDCVELALPAVLCGHLVLSTSPDIAAQFHLQRDFVKFCSAAPQPEFFT